MTHYILFVIELATRRVRIAGITVQSDAGWMMQMGRNLLDVFDEPLVDKRYLIVDRDTKYCAEFRQMLCAGGCLRDPTAVAFAQFECIRRTLRAFGKRGVPVEDDSDRAGDAASRIT